MEGRAMRHFVLASMLVVGLAFTACGGAPKPPMVPDDSTLGGGDGGADMPTASPPAPIAPPAAK
jgi:hypothetical protein